MATEKTIWWSNYCGNKSVYNALWNSSLTIWTTQPDITLCFQRSVLSFVPAFFLFIIIIPYSIFLIKSPTYSKGFYTSKFNLLKVTTSLALVITSLVELIWFISISSSSSSLSSLPSSSSSLVLLYDVQIVDYVYSTVKIVLFFIVTIVTHKTYKKAIHSSGFLFIFWFLQTMAAIFIFRSIFFRPVEGLIQGTTTVNLVLTLLSFFFCFFSDLLPNNILYKIHKPNLYRNGDMITNYNNNIYNNVLGMNDSRQEEEEEGEGGDDKEKKSLKSKDIKLVNVYNQKNSQILINQRKINNNNNNNNKNKNNNDEDEGPLNPQLTAPFFSVVLFWWFMPTILKGWLKTITWSDIFQIRYRDSCSNINPQFQKNWNNAKLIAHQKNLKNPIKENTALLEENQSVENKRGRRRRRRGFRGPATASLPRALWHTFKGTFFLGGIYMLIYDFFIFINPYLLNLLLDFIRNKDPHNWHGYCYAMMMLFSSVLGVLCMSHSFNFSYTVGMRIRTALTSAIYKKALTISPKSRKETTIGEIVNLMSVDAQKVADSLNLMHYIWSSPLVLVLSIVMLWQYLGPSTMAGVGFLLIVLPLNSMILAKLIREFHRVQMALKDARLKLMNQILTGIKILKLYAWEAYFSAKILEIRQSELDNLRKSQLLGAITYVLWFCSSFLVALLCFTSFVLSSPSNVLDPKITFVSLSLIMLMNFPLTILAPTIMFFVQAIVSAKRIERFLLQEDVDVDAVQKDHDPEYAVRIDSGFFSWDDDDTPTLTNINLNVKHKELVAIIGPVGCGKTSLLSAILGDIKKRSGVVNVDGTIAYVSQQAWIQNLTLKKNILFNKPYNRKLYKKVIGACALQPDIEILTHKDETEIGERGITLSGGQKQRISLARALYQQNEIIILDDTLSAVDAHVTKQIFDDVISKKGILKDKTRILVTHNVALLPLVDRVVVMSGGEVEESGTFDQLIEKKEGGFSEFLRNYFSKLEIDEQISQNKEVMNELLEIQRKVNFHSPMDSPMDSPTNGNNNSPSKVGMDSDNWRIPRKAQGVGGELITQISDVKKSLELDEEESKEVLKNLMQEEIAEEGAIKLSVLTSYLGSSSLFFVILLIISCICFITAYCLTNIWLSIWSNDAVVNIYNKLNNSNNISSIDKLLNQNQQQAKLRIGIYALLGAFQTLSMTGVIYSIIFGCLLASRNLHAKLLQNILRTPMSFFETVPIGRILNRFSKDIDILDSNIPQFSQNLLSTLCPLIATLIIISYTLPIFIAIVVPLLIFFVFLQRVYIACARQIKRIDSIKRSPIYAYFSETIAGTSTIRAYGQIDQFSVKSDQLVDESQRVWYEVFTANRWMGVWSEFIADIMVFFTALFAILQRENLDSSLVGLAISFAFQINISIIMTVRSSCELETFIVAAERVKEYSEVENEADLIIETNRPIPYWPSKGQVTFDNYSTRYREGLELVLRNIKLNIKSEEKVGIVGRTGAGKSSMTLALFRIIEPANGSIIIDGLDIKNIGLHDVRKKLTVIPQDPVLFSGSLRFNLDPADNFSDHEIWQALEQAHLKQYVKGLAGQINHDCGEDGANLSVGQRQLLCLARALLRRSKILVMDEATAAIDLETDDLIQSTIRSEFKSCTVLTIAHRINTIMDYDRILVLENGEVKEFDPPKILLSNESSIFFSLAKDAGLVN